MSTPRIALVTGANKGLGLETARQLGAQGFHVLIGSRDQGRGEAAVAELRAQGAQADLLVIDMEDSASIARAAEEVKAKYGRLDVLVNNAGVQIEAQDDWGAATASSIGPDLLRRTFEVNLFGLVDLTQRLLPLLQASEAGRIVNLSSILGSLTLHADPASPIYSTKLFGYNSSKTALNAFTVHLAYELRDTPVKVNSAHPGWVKTDMGGSEAPMDIVSGAKTAVALATLPPDGPSGAFLHLGEPLPW